MNHSEFTFRTAHVNEDFTRLKNLFDAVFGEKEKVGQLATTLLQHYPNTKPKYWFLAEHKASGELAAAFTLIPWQWRWFGQTLNVAEQGIVATLPKYQGLGLQTRLNKLFDQSVATDGFDLAIIQGIPGFYHKFGYHYSLPIDNHVNLEWRQIPAIKEPRAQFRLATEQDIDFLMEQDEITAAHFESSNFRNRETWQYLLTHSKATEYGSDFWIAESDNTATAYFRRCYTGFGDGMIVSEASENIPYTLAIELLNFLKQENTKHNKPYLRLNLSNQSCLSKIAHQLGAPIGNPYGFQIKIPCLLNWLIKQETLLTERLLSSEQADFTGIFRLDFFQQAVDIQIINGSVKRIHDADEESEPTASACIPTDLAPALLLGRHHWQELRQTRPDIFGHSRQSERLLEIMLPVISSWHHIPY